MPVVDQPCHPRTINGDKIWPYSDYYIGEKDAKGRRNGVGENNWNGAESLESYAGEFLRDSAHGAGVYRWRELAYGQRLTYEGRLYADRRHGYGRMSYPDGRTFFGLYHNDARWGPGVETHTSLREDVGLWRGSQLVRLAWRPDPVPGAAAAVPDLTAAASAAGARVKLVAAFKELNNVNVAFEKLKSAGTAPQRAQELWRKLYSTNGTDPKSVLCYTDDYDRRFYGKRIKYLQEEDSTQPDSSEDNSEFSEVAAPELAHTFAAWNNSPSALHMMRHAYQHDDQRAGCLDLEAVMSGPRSRFKDAGKHENLCRIFLLSCYLGDIAKVSKLVNEEHVHTDVADMQGNTGLIYATCGNNISVVQFLLAAGAAVDAVNDSCCSALALALMSHCALRLGRAPADLPLLFLAPAAAPSTPAEEWMIRRDVPLPTVKPKITRTVSSKKSNLSIRHESDEMAEFDDVQTFQHSCLAFEERLELEASLLRPPRQAQYIMGLRDMAAEAHHFIHAADDRHAPRAPPSAVKVISEVIKRDGVDSSAELDADGSRRVQDARRLIEALLGAGAGVRRARWPQPAPALAVAAGDAELLAALLRRGADVNESYPEHQGYRPLDMAIARDWSEETLSLVSTLLEHGASCGHRLRSPDPLAGGGDPAQPAPGPTLLHAVLARSADAHESQYRSTLLELLLRHGCDAHALFRGQTAVGAAMSQDLALLNVFIMTSQTDLNAPISDANHTILSRLLTPKAVRIDDFATLDEIVTNLMLYGADPFQEIRLGQETFGNIFEYCAKIGAHSEIAGEGNKIEQQSKRTSDSSRKKPKAAKSAAAGVASHSALPAAAAAAAARALRGLADAARARLVRAVQAALLRALAAVVAKYQHRAWHLIIPAHDAADARACGLWLTPRRCAAAWRALGARPRGRTPRALALLLCIVRYYNIRNTVGPVTFKLKESIEKEVSDLLDREPPPRPPSPPAPGRRPLYCPELDTKINPLSVCFECLSPAPERRLFCGACRQVGFCSDRCRDDNAVRFVHPCTQHLAARAAAARLQAETNREEEEAAAAAAEIKKQKPTRK